MHEEKDWEWLETRQEPSPGRIIYKGTHSHTQSYSNMSILSKFKISKVVIKYTKLEALRAQTSLAEADHYSHIAHCKNVEPWLWKTADPNKKK